MDADPMNEEMWADELDSVYTARDELRVRVAALEAALRRVTELCDDGGEWRGDGRYWVRVLDVFDALGPVGLSKVRWHPTGDRCPVPVVWHPIRVCPLCGAFLGDTAYCPSCEQTKAEDA